MRQPYDPRLLKLTSLGRDFMGEDLKGKPLRVFLLPSKGTYQAKITNRETGSEISSDLPSGRPLYFRLKSCQTLHLSNTTYGFAKLLQDAVHYKQKAPRESEE